MSSCDDHRSFCHPGESFGELDEASESLGPEYIHTDCPDASNFNDCCDATEDAYTGARSR